MHSLNPSLWLEVSLIWSMVFLDHNCQPYPGDLSSKSSSAGRCYDCIEFDGIRNLECSYPVGRGAKVSECGFPLGDGVDDAKCAKVVVYSEGYKEGWQLKSWIMKRQCFIPKRHQKKYGILNPPCGSCGRTNAPIRIFQRLISISIKKIPLQIYPDEQNQVVILMCTCCEAVCNNEEGFNLSYFTRMSRSNAGKNRAGCRAFMFIGIYAFIQLRRC